MLQHHFPGLVVGGGRLELDDRPGLNELLRKLGGSRVVITVELERDLSANAAYWGRVIRGFEELGWDKDLIHEVLKRMFLWT